MVATSAEWIYGLGMSKASDTVLEGRCYTPVWLFLARGESMASEPLCHEDVENTEQYHTAGFVRLTDPTVMVMICPFDRANVSA